MLVKVRLPLILDWTTIEKIVRIKSNSSLQTFSKFKSYLSKGWEISPDWINYENLYNYQTVTATSKEMGKLLDSKIENTLPRWFKARRT